MELFPFQHLLHRLGIPHPDLNRAVRHDHGRRSADAVGFGERDIFYSFSTQLTRSHLQPHLQPFLIKDIHGLHATFTI